VSTYQKPIDDLAALISTAVGAAITTAHFTVDGILPTKNDASAYNTKASISMTAASTAYKGRKTFYYDRLQLDSLGRTNLLRPTRRSVVGAGVGTSIYLLFNELRDTLGIQFDINELEETFAFDDGEGVSVVLKAKPKALGWIGTYTQKFSYYPNIVNAFWGNGLSGF
jgi:hypothetical protein